MPLRLPRLTRRGCCSGACMPYSPSTPPIFLPETLEPCAFVLLVHFMTFKSSRASVHAPHMQSTHTHWHSTCIQSHKSALHALITQILRSTKAGLLFCCCCCCLNTLFRSPPFLGTHCSLHFLHISCDSLLKCANFVDVGWAMCGAFM